MSKHRWLCLLSFLLAATVSFSWKIATAQGYNILEECSSLSTEPDDIHNCLDNYLDVMDDNIADITAFIERELDGLALVAFGRSQQAFYDYRRQNCLWYLEFSLPRDRGNQIAKNCLASMSQQRLSELQTLIDAETNSQASLRGFYIYGPNRNSFQPCGSPDRYWVEGDNTVVGQMQQEYLQQATTELQVLFVLIKGLTDDSTQSYADHKGLVRVSELVELRVPLESDCQLPGGTLSTLPSVKTSESTDYTSNSTDTDADQTAQDTVDDQPEQQLRAYFGEWQVECIQSGNSYECELAVQFRDSAAAGGDHLADSALPSMRLTRRRKERTLVELRFPDREIDSAHKIRWRVDRYTFGDIVGSDIRVDESATRQLVHERRFIRDDLLPLMLKGGELGVEVLADDEGSRGERFSATLLGLSRALTFADDFIHSGGNL